MPKSTQSTSTSLQSQTDECGVAHLSPTALSLMAGFFKVLSEASRLQIVCVLKAGPKNVTEIIEATGLGQANVSKHLKMMAQAGIVARQQKGVSAYYQIANPFVFELCELVCDALSIQFEQRNQQFEQLDAMRQGRE
ncbi:MAG: ArsR/SmtB family transcription factor [Leptolyngbyaceae cyanobacterium]